MATLQELQNDIDTLKSDLNNPNLTQEDKDILEQSIQYLEDRKQQLQTSNLPATTTPSVPDDGMMTVVLSGLLALLESFKGSGGDSPATRDAIREYLKTEKIKLNELSKEVLDEIKKNQTVYLQLPNYSKKIEMPMATSKLPNMYSILDDVTVGNNVFLIGEAGGGKTYTAEQVAKLLQREIVVLNCSQYTSPLEILGGQSIEGFKKGKLIDCWENGKILLLDEMPKLDANTAGLFNDALAKSTKTTLKEDAKINSANAGEPPIERADGFAIIATGNVYPNTKPVGQYSGNNQQDLSLLDRFSGSVYFTEFDNYTDQKTTLFKFLYDFLIGNYYQWMNDKTLEPRGLRTVLKANNYTNMALVSYRSNTAFRVAFEFELVREIAKRAGQNISDGGKTLLKAFKSFMVAFQTSPDATRVILDKTKYTDAYITTMVSDAINKILKNTDSFKDSINKDIAPIINDAFKRYENLYVAETLIIQDAKP